MKKFSILALIAGLLSFSSAFAIDQVILKNGDVVEGKVLRDVPNRHVDIQLVNGSTKRFERAEVASVERDVPSTKDRDMIGNESRLYVGGLAGMALWNGAGQSKIGFNYGARFGVVGNPMGDLGRFSAGLSIDRYSFNEMATDFAFTSIMAQLLLKRIANTGFYFGPEIGLGIVTISNAFVSNFSGEFLEYGALLGYEYFLNPGFSFGPEIHYDRNAEAEGSNYRLNSSGVLKILFAGTFHF